MKICAIIAEYNPFHLGHKIHLDYVKNELGAEKIIVIMSGNFCQRGENAVLDKFTRARHAILSGADMVIELPTVFATQNAEIFAKGSVDIINALGVCDGLCFGVESGVKEDYISLATALNDESKEFKRALKEKLDSGVSLAKAKFLAVKETSNKEFNADLLSSPNNILGLEYVKALLKINSKIQPVPMLRLGDHNDKTLKKGVTSATSIRKAILDGEYKKTKKSLPLYVFEDLKDCVSGFDNLIMASAITTPAHVMKNITDCTEGLENRIKALIKDNLSLPALIDKVSTKRYTATRIQRILINNLLQIDNGLVKEALSTPTYAKILAVKREETDLIPLIVKNSSIPVLTRKSDTLLLKKSALKVYEKDVLANDIYNFVSGKKQNENQMLII